MGNSRIPAFGDEGDHKIMQQAQYRPSEASYSGKPSNYADLETQNVAHEVANCSAEVKAGFIRKVYSILSMQLMLTVVGAATFMFVESARTFALSSPGVMYTALFLPFIVLFALFCYKNKHPANMYLLTIFTVCEAYTVGVVCAVYYEQGYGLIVLLVWGMLNMFFPVGGGVGHAIFSLMGALLFSGYILYDTSVIMHHMGPDDYIMASVSLYLDIINLFLYLLQILRFLQND